MTIEHIQPQPKPVRLPKACKSCGAIGHSAFNCPKRPRKPMRAKKRLDKMGKVGKKWLEVRNHWFKLHNTSTYMCYLCGRLMPREETTLDHKLSRGRHPELRYDLNNLAPCCAACNKAKGSLSATEYLAKLRKETNAT